MTQTSPLNLTYQGFLLQCLICALCPWFVLLEEWYSCFCRYQSYSIVFHPIINVEFVQGYLGRWDLNHYLTPYQYHKRTIQDVIMPTGYCYKLYIKCTYIYVIICSKFIPTKHSCLCSENTTFLSLIIYWELFALNSCTVPYISDSLSLTRL